MQVYKEGAADGSAEHARQTALTALFSDRYRALVRVAHVFGAETDAEDIVSEAFCELCRRWDELRSHEAALRYLHAVIRNMVAMRTRHLMVVQRHVANTVDETVSAEAEVLREQDREHAQRAVVAALRMLSPRQREVQVLRYWAELDETEIATSMGISAGTVKSHAARASKALIRRLQQQP